MRVRGGHPDEAILEAYLRGLMPPRKVRRIEEHMLTCPECVAAAEEVEVYLRAMRAALDKKKAKLAIAGKNKTN
jgi:anti-sigma factor RsiW